MLNNSKMRIGEIRLKGRKWRTQRVIYSWTNIEPNVNMAEPKITISIACYWRYAVTRLLATPPMAFSRLSTPESLSRIRSDDCGGLIGGAGALRIRVARLPVARSNLKFSRPSVCRTSPQVAEIHRPFRFRITFRHESDWSKPKTRSNTQSRWPRDLTRQWSLNEAGHGRTDARGIRGNSLQTNTGF